MFSSRGAYPRRLSLFSFTMVDVDQWFSVIANQLKTKLPRHPYALQLAVEQSIKNTTSHCSYIHSVRDFEGFTEPSAPDTFTVTGWQHLRLSRSENQVVGHWKVNLRDNQWLPLFAPPVIIQACTAVPLRLIPPVIPDYSSLLSQLKEKKLPHEEWNTFIEEEKGDEKAYCATCMELRKLQQQVVIRQGTQRVFAK